MPPANRKTSLPRSRIKVTLLESIHPRATETFYAAGYTQVENHPKSLAGDRLREVLADTHILGIRSATRLTAEVLAAAPKLFSVGCFCIGTNQVDLGAAQEAGIAVFNAPFSNTRSVAELVMAETIFLLRRIPERNAEVHRGVWRKLAEGAHEARGRVLGIVGYGHIGTQVGLLAEAFGMKVLYYDIETKLALGNAQPVSSLEQLLERSDVVTLHVPETPRTAGMIGSAQLERMQKGSALINASRGTVVDLEALAGALERGHLSGAAVDVYPVEPKANDEPFHSPLLRFDNVLLTPHVAGSTLEAQQSIGVEVAEKLVRYSDNGSSLTSVNFPEVTLPEQEGRHRLLHIHRNQPGVLARLNDVFSRHQVNVSGEYLRTSERIGYVVIDFDPGTEVDTPAMKKEIEAIDGTLRCRLLY